MTEGSEMKNLEPSMNNFISFFTEVDADANFNSGEWEGNGRCW